MRTPVLGAVLLVGILCAAAQARPRDDVMAGAYRCAGQSATRAWLDCYYGAAQPQRAALNLSPAPAAQVKLLDAPPDAGVPQDSAARDAVMAAAARCGGIAGDRDWLNCYYAATNPVRAVLGLPSMSGPAPVPVPVPALASVPHAPVVRAERHDPGVIAGLLGASDFKTSSRMASYSLGRNFTVTLENGQVWRQTDGESNTARWDKPARMYQVTITGGAFGTYNLAVKGSPDRFKVARVP